MNVFFTKADHMNSDHNHHPKITKDGNLEIPLEIARKYGFTPGSQLIFDEKEDGIFFRRPILHLAKVYIEPTSQCNLACRTCIRNAWEEPMGMMTEATFEQVIRGLQAYDPHPSVFFGGFGEPLSHPRIVDMVARAKTVSNKVELITNGMLLTEECSRALIQAGLSTLWVSVDGATPESYADIRLGAALPDIFKNIARYRDLYRQAVGGEPGIGIVFVAMKRNIADLPELLRMSLRLGVSRYLVTNVLPYTTEMCDERLYTRSADTLPAQPSPWAPRLEFPQMDANQHTRETLIRVMNDQPRNFLVDAGLAEHRNRCPFVRQGSTAIAWDGNLSPCLALMHQYESFLLDLRRVVRRYVIGNVSEHSLLELWKSPEYVDFRQRVDKFDFAPCTVCASCEMAESNQEDCYGNAFPTCGGCLWAQGFIRCP
jgi:MoaA/NifB/PqqE/SkfB family radical SAM enzyme